MSADPDGSKPATPVSIAIVGAGPAGFYTAGALVKLGLDCRIDILEALPSPFGLIRAGVAPDHQSTKQVTRAFTRTAQERPVHYYGNLKVGRDVTVEELRGLYDAVVLAIGTALDRRLDIPGADKSGVYGAAEFVGWYNGHPDHIDLDPNLDVGSVCVIGNGNVALDVARVLVRRPEEMTGSDLPPHAAEAIYGAPIRDVYVLGRRGPAEAKFSNKELNEMGALGDATPVVDATDIPESVVCEGTRDGSSERDRRLHEKNLATLRGFAKNRPDGSEHKRVHFIFHAQPVEVLGDGDAEALRLERTRVEDGRAVGCGEFFEIPCGLIIAAIGYRLCGLPGIPVDRVRSTVVNDDGRVSVGLYVVGWAKRGPTGVIGTNKRDGDVVAAHIRDDHPVGRKPGRAALEDLMTRRQIRWVSFEDWQKIDAAETAAAPPGAPRRKLIRIKDMLAILDQDARAVTKT